MSIESEVKKNQRIRTSYMLISRTTISQDVQTRFPVQLAFAKFLSKIKGNFYYSASIMDTTLPQKFSLYFR